MYLIRTLIVAFIFALISLQSAVAAEPPAVTAEEPVTAGGFFERMDGAVREVGRKAGRELGRTLATSGYTVAATVTDTALRIAGALGVMYLLYEVMQFLSGRTKSMLQVLFDVGIPCMFAAAFITHYGQLLTMFEGFLDVFRNLGGGMDGGASDPFNGILNVYTAVIGKIAAAIKDAFTAYAEAAKAVWNPFKTALGMVDLLVTVFFALCILILLLLGIAEVLGLLLIGPFLFAVGVAFGPIMIAGLVTPWTRDYFTKWLQFLVISAGLTGVINVIFTIAKHLMDSVQVGEAVPGQPTAVGLVVVAILILTINSMISQAPSIASALFPGHVGVSKSSGAGVASVGKALKGKKNDKKDETKFGRGTANGIAGGLKQAAAFAKSKTPGP